MMVVVGIMAIMSLAGYLSISRLQSSTDAQTAVDSLFATIQSQRLAAMLGSGTNTEDAVAQGIYFIEGLGTYVLFSCPDREYCVYGPSLPNSQVRTFEQTTIFRSVLLPDSQVVFAPYSGEVLNYNDSTNTVIIYNEASRTSETIRISSVGTPQLVP